MRKLLVILAFSFTGVLFAQFEPNVPEELQTSLTSRVDQLYLAFQEGRFRDGEAFVDEESQETYYNMTKTRIMGHEVTGIEWDDGMRSAKVTAAVQMVVPMMGGKPLRVPVASFWRLVDGEWYAHLSPPSQRRETPFGEIKPRDPNAPPTTSTTTAIPPDAAPRPSAASFRRLIQVDNRTIAFSAEGDEPVVRTLTLKSRAQDGLVLTVRPLMHAPEGITVEPASVEVEPGGEAELILTYQPDPNAEPISGQRRWELEVSPTGQRLRLTFDFGTRRRSAAN